MNGEARTGAVVIALAALATNIAKRKWRTAYACADTLDKLLETDSAKAQKVSPITQRAS